MKITYSLRTDKVYDEDGILHTDYGIEAFANKKHKLVSVADVFFDKHKAEEFIKLCNDLKLSLIHLPNAIEDVIE